MKRYLQAIGAALLVLVVAGAGQTDVPEQTPINIRTADAIQAQLPKLSFRYVPATHLKLVNTGSPDQHRTGRAHVTARARHPANRPNPYPLLPIHWHLPAEHRVNG